MANLLRVLIVEDNDDDRQLLAVELQSGGYDLVHECVQSADKMRAALVRGQWDVVISDYAMPGFCGIEALQILQERGLDLPFIIVSGKIGEACRRVNQIKRAKAKGDLTACVIRAWRWWRARREQQDNQRCTAFPVKHGHPPVEELLA